MPAEVKRARLARGRDVRAWADAWRRARAVLAGAALCAVSSAATGCMSFLPSPAAPSGEQVIADRDIDAPARRVSAREALADLDFAARVFADAYAAPEGLAPTPDPRALAGARSAIAARSTWEPRELARLFRDLFRKPDGHLVWEVPGETRAHFFALEPSEREGDGDGASKFAFLGSTMSRAEGSQSPPFEAASRGAGPDEGPVVSLQRGEVPVLRIATFDSAHAPELARLPELADHLRASKTFVIDLRGNRGGNFQFALDFLLSLTSDQFEGLGEREVVSAAAAEGRENRLRQRLARGEVPAGALQHFEAQQQALEAQARSLRAENAPRRDVRRRPLLRGRARAPLAGNAVLLVDRGCASACEMFVALARQLPGMVVAGERTHGAFAVGEIALFRMPHSGIAVSLGTRAFVDPLGRYDETRGFEPDVPMPAGVPAALAARIATERTRFSKARGAKSGPARR